MTQGFPGAKPRDRCSRRFAAAVFAALLLQSAPGPLLAQGISLRDYSISSWRQEDGLPVNSTFGVAQTADGYIWVATDAGLARFDGLSFTRFSSRTEAALTTSPVYAVRADAAGTLWVGTGGAGVFRYTNGRFESVAGTQPGTAVNAFLVGDTIWAATSTGLESFTPAGERIGKLLDGRFVRVLNAGGQGRVWAGTAGDGIWLIENGREIRLPALRQFEDEDIRSLLEDPRQRLWIGTRAGLFRWDRRTGEVRRLLPANVGFVEALLRDGGGDVWAGTSLRGLFRWHGESIDSLTTEDGMPAGDVRGLFEDRTGGIWVALDHSGLVLLQPARLLSFTPRDGLSNPITLAILGTPDSAMWVATWGGGVNRIARDGSVRVYDSADGLSSNQVMSLAAGRDGSVWVGTRDGLNRIRGGQVTRWGEREGVPDPTVSAVYTDRTGRVWIGTNHGLAWFDGARFRTVPLAEGSQFVFAIHQDRSGALWVGTNGGGVHRIVGDSIRTFTTAHGLASDLIMAIHEDAEGMLWFATVGGLSRLAGDRFQSVRAAQGLPTAEVLSLNESGPDFWYGSNEGLYRMSRQAIIDVLDGRAARFDVEVFSMADGMPSSETNGAFQPSSWRDYAGRLWFPTMGGAVIVDPHREPPQAHVWPPLVTEVLLNHDTVVAPGRLDPGVRYLMFSFTAPAFPDSRNLQFRYRLDGYDREWIEAGVQRRAQYTNVDPGRYEFHVEVRRPGGPWIGASAPVRFAVAPFFHQRAWVRAAALLLVVLIAFLLHHRRTTALRRRQAELLGLIADRERAEARFRSLFENARDIVLSLDANGIITSINRAGVERLGRSAEELRGTAFVDLVAPADRAAARDWLTALLAGEEPPQLHELDVLAATGTEIPLEITWQVQHEEGDPVLVQLIARDVSERQQMESELRQAQKMDAIGVLAGGVAHDFNNLLTAIRGNAALAYDSLPQSAPQRDDLTEVLEASDRAAALTQQLLAFSRRQPHHPGHIDLNEALSHVGRMLVRLIGERVDLALELEPGLPPVYVDRIQLDQVVLNLVVNARDAMPDGGRITIRTKRLEDEGGSWVLIEVADTGVGIPADVKPHIFEPFFTTKAPDKGTGLGLSTVYGIVQQNHGRIEVDTAPGQGTTFRVALPASSTAELPAPTALASAANARRGSELVLLVEDDNAVRRGARRLLEARGFRVLEAPNGAAAVAVAKSAPRVDVLLTDVVMPGIPPGVLIHEVRALHPSVKVVLMSGYAAEELSADEELRSIPFVQKPFNAEHLTSVIRAQLDAS